VPASEAAFRPLHGRFPGPEALDTLRGVVFGLAGFAIMLCGMGFLRYPQKPDS
jgi:hypothetical protein